jgi:hypothetical protein
MARVGLKAEGYLLPGGIPGAAVIESLDSTNGIYLDNPEIIGLFDLLQVAGLITQATRDKVSDFITSQLATTPAPASNLRKYKLAAPAGVTSLVDYSVFLSPWITGDLFIEEVGEFKVSGSCSNPDAVEVL